MFAPRGLCVCTPFGFRPSEPPTGGGSAHSPSGFKTYVDYLLIRWKRIIPLEDIISCSVLASAIFFNFSVHENKMKQMKNLLN